MHEWLSVSALCIVREQAFSLGWILQNCSIKTASSPTIIGSFASAKAVCLATQQEGIAKTINALNTND